MSEQLEQIHQLLDGELDSVHESALYAKLAVDDDLRSEMREQMALKNAVNEDRMALVPPAALTNSVFTGLGFAAPLAGAAAGAVGGGVLMQWLTRLGIPVLSAIAAVGITLGTSSEETTAVISSSDTAVETNTAAVEAPQQTQPVGKQEVTSSEAVTGPRVIERIVERPADPRLREQLAFYQRETDRLQAELTASQDRVRELEGASVIASNQQILTDAPVAQQVDITNSYTLVRHNDLQRFSGSVTPLVMKSITYPAWTAQVRGFSLSPTTATNVDPQREWYSDLGFALMYQVNEHHSVGAELGHEPFAMVFEGDRNGQTLQYDQNPTTMWVGPTYRYTGSQFGDVPLAPYGQATAAFSQYGPVGRLAAGLQYSPVGPLTFLLGLEGSALAYRYQDNLYVSPNVGLTYGMAVRF